MTDAKKTMAALIAVLTILVAWACSSSMLENLEADQVMVVQAPWSGELTWHTTPGTKWQLWGTVTKYHRRTHFSFGSKDKAGKPEGEPLKIKFNEGGEAKIFGSLSWDLPLTPEHLTEIHQKFHSEEALEAQLIRTNIDKAVSLTGPMMSSFDSYGARKAEMLSLIEDQLVKGPYRIRTEMEMVEDPITKEKKQVRVAKLMTDPKTGEIAREITSPLEHLGITVSNISMSDVEYEEKVKAQIDAQREASMAIQTAIAETKTAEQQALTTAAKGSAEAAATEWKQKAIAAGAVALATQEKDVAVLAAAKTKEVALAEASQKFEVAQLGAQTAEQEKLAAILKGEGEAEARRLIMNADGGLEKKLAAYIEVVKAGSTAIGSYTGNWSPQIVMGGQGASTGTTTAGTGIASAQQFMDMLVLKTAKDLSLDVLIPNKAGDLQIKKPAMNTFEYKAPAASVK